MPLYEYRCPSGTRVEKLRKYDDRDRNIPSCACCGLAMTRIPSAQHCVPDGMYSYAPNLGDPEKFERRHEASKHRQKVIEVD